MGFSVFSYPGFAPRYPRWGLLRLLMTSAKYADLLGGFADGESLALAEGLVFGFVLFGLGAPVPVCQAALAGARRLPGAWTSLPIVAAVFSSGAALLRMAAITFWAISVARTGVAAARAYVP